MITVTLSLTQIIRISKPKKIKKILRELGVDVDKGYTFKYSEENHGSFIIAGHPL